MRLPIAKQLLPAHTPGYYTHNSYDRFRISSIFASPETLSFQGSVPTRIRFEAGLLQYSAKECQMYSPALVYFWTITLPDGLELYFVTMGARSAPPGEVCGL